MMDLKEASIEIREIINNRQKELKLTFEEETHTYTMADTNNLIKNDWPSVSKIMKYFYTEFDTEGISYKKAKGDPVIQKKLLEEWKSAGDYSTNMGSRTHFILEKKSLEMFDIKKEIRQPIFDCDFTQILKSDSMVSAGINFLELMKERGAMLLDTEIILGDNKLGYTGAPDKVWLINNKEKTEICLLITDYKTNKPKNFESNIFTKKMKKPFENLEDTALGHYTTQLPFYGKLILEMLKGSKYENIKLIGCIIVLLKETGEFEEFRINKNIINTILEMDMGKYILKK